MSSLIYEFPHIRMQAVMTETRSHVVACYGYLPTEILLVKLVDGPLIGFKGVPPAVYKAMQDAPSVGKFYLREVRDRFHYERVSPTAYRVYTMPDDPPTGTPPSKPLWFNLDAMALLPDAWI